jgi:hypothetical protein
MFSFFMSSAKTSRRLIILGQLLFLSCCTALPQATELESMTTPSKLNLDGRITVVAPSPAKPSNDKIEASIIFLQQYFKYMPLLNESLIPPHHIYYGCFNSDEAGVILNYEIKSSFESFYPQVGDKFNSANWTYRETEIVEDDLNHRMMFFKSSTTQPDSTIMDIQGTILESLSSNPNRLSITVTFSYISDSTNYQNFENKPSNDWILSNPKSALLELCSNGQWSVWNP